MKYIVMERHEGYAVLMDENAGFVTAADLHYEVGQTVTDPIILSERNTERKIAFTAGRLIAAAACLVLFASAGLMYYSHNLKPHSTVVISANANIRMEVNKKGKVIHVVSDSESGKELLENYSGKGKDKLTVANEIIELELQKGYISNGDTIDLYISSDDEAGYETFRSDLEKSVSDISVSVHGVGDTPGKPAKPENTEKRPEPPKPDNGETPKKPGADKEKPAQPPSPPAVAPPENDKAPAQKPEPPKDSGKADSPAPPAAAEPKAPGKQQGENDHGEAKKPEAPAEPAKPSLPGESETPKHQHEPDKSLSGEIEIPEQPFTLKELRPTALLPEAEASDLPE